jgi:hypothetical protein
MSALPIQLRIVPTHERKDRPVRQFVRQPVKRPVERLPGSPVRQAQSRGRLGWLLDWLLDWRQLGKQDNLRQLLGNSIQDARICHKSLGLGAIRNL